MNNSLLDIRKLRTWYRMERGDVKAVDGVNLSLKQNEILGLLGESGCGKSTLGLSLLRLVPPPGEIMDGKILFKGNDLLQKSKKELRKIRGKEIAMIFQDPSASLDPLMRSGKHIVQTITQHKASTTRKDAKERAYDLLEGVNLLSNRFNDYPHQLSGGMKQRIMIATSLALNPDLIIADEPTSSLDVAVEAQILDLIEQQQEKYNLSMIFITHNAALIAEIADRVALMYAGRICEVSDVMSFFENPLHPYARELEKALPDIQATNLKLQYLPGTPPDLIDPPKGCRFHPRCPVVMDKCKKEDPPLFKVDDRFVKCFKFEER